MIEYEIPEASHVALAIYNAAGRLIQTLVDEDQQAGVYRTEFDAQGLASGVYFYRLVTPEGTLTMPIILMK